MGSRQEGVRSRPGKPDQHHLFFLSVTAFVHRFLTSCRNLNTDAQSALAGNKSDPG